MAFVRHLAGRGVRVAEPIASREGRDVEPLEGASASMIEWAKGEHVTPDDPRADAGFHRAWGHALARIHHEGCDYDGPPRWDWDEEGWLADADELLPRDDTGARAEWDAIRGHLAGLQRTPESYGMIHGDHGAQNFRYGDAGLTTFDFGNCCRHWYAMDVVIALSTLRTLPDARQRARWLLEGYREVRELDASTWGERAWFGRLRLLYVYLSRLSGWPNPTAEQRAFLARLRARVGGSGS